MLDLFTSVGARSFVITKTDIHQEVLLGKTYSATELRSILPAMVRTAAIRKPCMISETQGAMAGENLIMRPMGPELKFIQLDDLSA